ncbi:hypothetical protein F5Y16DRAFT_424193 [Xylariaceae sp. FL0255]|nr:hypothetical protein F5Y16DRAFT_424193 [Xylariaceae sp. FL0255]
MDEQQTQCSNEPQRRDTASPDGLTCYGGGLEQVSTVRTLGMLKLRGKSDDLPSNWWFASTAVPLLAATQGPLSNVMSIAALVTTWRVQLPENGQLVSGGNELGSPIRDPEWELALNAVSLGCGFAGNLLLLLHFVDRIRYIVAIPLSIILWLLASILLIATTAAVSVYIPPVPPGETYTQGFWYAVIAAVTYAIGSSMLIANFIGYLLGHYPQSFVLVDDQRTLILQTMMFFIWLAGGAAVFTRLEGWGFADALYYCNVSVLTIGYGDLYPTSNASRGFFFVYELIGITQLGLVISRLSRYMSNMSADKVIKKHQDRARQNTFGRTVTTEAELRERLGLPPKRRASLGKEMPRRNTLTDVGKFKIIGNMVTFQERKTPLSKTGGRNGKAEPSPLAPTKRTVAGLSLSQVTSKLRTDRRKRLLVLKEEQDRFNAMRQIEDETRRFKQYYTLCVTVLTFVILWAVGAVIFMFTEAETQHLDYFDAFYFCFVTLLTVGYGDISPKSNAGKAFFLVWSLIAVPSITVLIQALSDTVVSGINRVTNVLLPEKGFLNAFLETHPNHWLTRFVERKRGNKRVDAGFQLQDPEEACDSNEITPDGSQEKEETELENLSKIDRDSRDEHQLARQLAVAIRSVAKDLRSDPPKRYSYAEWAHFTKLIRFSSGAGKTAVEKQEEEEGLVSWDWIGEDSPMLADSSESEWVLDRLCESLNRYTRSRHVDRSWDSGGNENRDSAGQQVGIVDDDVDPLESGPSSYP